MDGTSEVQDNSGLVVLLRAQCQAQERELASLRSEKITESITQQMSALEESLAKTVSSDCTTITLLLSDKAYSYDHVYVHIYVCMLGVTH